MENLKQSGLPALYVAWKRGFPQKFARFVLFCPIKKRSFNLLCVLGVNEWILFKKKYMYVHLGHLILLWSNFVIEL